MALVVEHEAVQQTQRNGGSQRGVPTGRCPYCGHAFHIKMSVDPLSPWQQRSNLPTCLPAHLNTTNHGVYQPSRRRFGQCHYLRQCGMLPSIWIRQWCLRRYHQHRVLSLTIWLPVINHHRYYSIHLQSWLLPRLYCGLHCGPKTWSSNDDHLVTMGLHRGHYLAMYRFYGWTSYRRTYRYWSSNRLVWALVDMFYL